MSFFTVNNQGQSESLFKKPSGFPSRSRKNFNNTQSTCNNENVENTHIIFKKVEERYEVLKKLCQDQPEDLKKILNETVDRLTQACYEKVAEKVLPSSSQAFSIGGSSVCSLNTRSSVPAPAASHYGPSIANIPEPQFESTRRKNNSTATSKNHYGLLNSAIPEDRPISFPSEQFSRANDVFYEPEPPQRTLPNKSVRPKKTVNSTIDRAAKQVAAAGLSIPLRIEKSNAPATQSKRSSKKQATEVKELEVLPSEDESDSLSVFFGKGRNALKQSTTARSKQSDQSKKPTKSHNLSVTLQRVEAGNENASAGTADPSRKRKASQNDEAPSRKRSPVAVEKEPRPSPDTTTSNITARKPTQAAANETLRRSNRNISILSTRKQEPAAKSKENKENRQKPKATSEKSKSQKEAKGQNAKTAAVTGKSAKTAPVVEEDAESNNDEVGTFDDGSIFDDVSSIVGTDSVVLSNTVAKNTTKHSAASRTDMQSHFFSPFSNIRSTSGVSAISTPLSKTLTKNVLGKRLKKPNAVAEFKNARTRKPPKANPVATDVAPLPENSSESSESEDELEASDFSN